MFEPSGRPRLFALPPGADFPTAVVQGLLERSSHMPPDAFARVELFVNTRRMQRRLSTLFDEGPALLLPRIRLVTDLGQDVGMADLAPAVSPLRRRLELSQLIGQLLSREPDLAPRAAIFDLADALAQLMDEMQGEGVSPDVIRALDVSDISGHWARSLKFVDIVERFFGADSGEPPDTEARQRQVIERLVHRWKEQPPEHPVIIAGSTGSRGATSMLMQAVANLPQGALILPGFDFDLPAGVWASLENAAVSEDHPQYRFAHLMNQLGTGSDDVEMWSSTVAAPSPQRNRLISLALRPAPVTDQWLTEGRKFCGVDAATAQMTLIEAPSPRAEAVAIALRLRLAAQEGQTAAVITPDRTLTRQITAALERWGIEPDDSAGRPLPLTAPGRFLRHIADLFGERLTATALLTLLKHPLTNTGGQERGDHLRWTRDLELEVLRTGLPFPRAGDLKNWAETHKVDDGRKAWACWVGELICGHENVGHRLLSDHLSEHLRVACALCAGPENSGAGELWEKPAGREAFRVVSELEHEASFGGSLSPRDYRDLFRAVLNGGEVRDPIAPHSGIMIWGTLEARVQGADLVILAGLNDGSWPELPSPDPWMNRKMRAEAGLLLPERRVGLAAHDFQQAIAAREVVLTRAVRDSESETVASRWVNRLANLLAGMSDDGETALKQMRKRGAYWLQLSDRLDSALDQPQNPATRPSPQPPVEARPKRLSVTRITKLIRDPYAVYAESILGLRPLDPLHQTPDAPLRGTVLHRVLERFVSERGDENHAQARARLLAITDEVLEEEAPWPAARILWRAKLERVADWFLNGEKGRRADGTTVACEIRGSLYFKDLDFTLSATADRIDRQTDGSYAIYDYKTGAPPSRDMQRHYDKQLLLEAVIGDAGGFSKLPKERVSSIAYIGLGSNPKFDPIELQTNDIEEIKDELSLLISQYQTRGQGYTSRRAVYKERFAGDFDHLARFGEWNDSQDASPEEVG